MTDEFLEEFEKRRALREQAERSFTIAGVELTHRPTVAPEIGMRLEKMRSETARWLTEVRRLVDTKNGNEPALPEQPYTDEEMLAVGEDTVLSCLTAESAAAWMRLRDPAAVQPLLYEEVFEIADYLLGRVSGIPTVAPADSSAGRTETAKPSKAKSSSRARTPTTSA